MIYLDNAATSFPKPESVYDAVYNAMKESGGNAGRSGHKFATNAGRIIREARILCARLFGAASSDNIVFTSNTTTALNIAIKGSLSPGDHVITSMMEHNSVSRPLNHMDVTISKLPELNPGDIKKALKPNTKLIVCAHISNVTGEVNNIDEIGLFCRENDIMFLADAAQSAGTRHIDVRYVDMLAFPGHKGLFGPQGTGGLYIRPGIHLKTIIEGGTGSWSESLSQPDNIPSRFESGTLNTPGLAGLATGIRFIFETGIEEIEHKEKTLTNRIINGIETIKGVRLIGKPGAGVVSVCFDKMSPAEAALIMDASFNIAVRSGLHCAADAHAHLGTLAGGGTLRISPNYFNTESDIDHCLMALEACSK